MQRIVRFARLFINNQQLLFIDCLTQDVCACVLHVLCQKNYEKSHKKPDLLRSDFCVAVVGSPCVRRKFRTCRHRKPDAAARTARKSSHPSRQCFDDEPRIARRRCLHGQSHERERGSGLDHSNEPGSRPLQNENQGRRTLAWRLLPACPAEW